MTDAELMQKAATALMCHTSAVWWYEVEPLYKALLNRVKEIEDDMGIDSSDNGAGISAG